MEQEFFNVLSIFKPVVKSWIKEALAENQTIQVSPEIEEEKFNAKEAALFLNLTLQTLYTKHSKGELPGCKAPGSKKLFFFKSDLIQFLKDGRKKTNAEVEAEAKAYLLNQKRGLNNGK
jgi:hypothetical protein